MRLLFDDNISYRIVKKMADSFPESLHASRTGIPHPAPDRVIWDFAKRNGLVVVTFDEDFKTFTIYKDFLPKSSFYD